MYIFMLPETVDIVQVMHVVTLMLGRDAVMMMLVMVVTERTHLFRQICILMVNKSHNDCMHQAALHIQIIEEVSAEQCSNVLGVFV